MRYLSNLICALSISACVSGCDVERHYGEQIPLSDGRIVYADLDSVVGPGEFLIPGYGPTKKLKITFHSPNGMVVWPGNPPEWVGLNNVRPTFPITFDLLDNIPVVVIEVVDGGCTHLGNPSNSLVAYAYKNGFWRRLPPEAIPLKWRFNSMPDINNKFLLPGHTYSVDDILMFAPENDLIDTTKTLTLAREIDRLREMHLLCSQGST